MSGRMESRSAIPLQPADLAEPAELVTAIRDRRGGQLLKVDRMLLHSPSLAQGWNVFMGTVRSKLSVPYRLRELSMCVVAVVNGARYEYEHHAPLYVDSGASQLQADALLQLKDEAASFPLEEFPESDQDVIALAREMTVEIEVSDALKRRLVQRFGVQQTIELVGVVAAYNMVSRFLVALGLHTEHRDDA